LATVASTVGCKNLYPAATRAPRSYFAVVYRAHAATEPHAKFEVRQADKFPALVDTWKTAALRAPDACGNDAAGCGSWLTQIERGLVERKLGVVSWSALRDVERTKQEPAHVAARELQADVVFVINEIDARAVPLGTDARETFDVYDTDEYGNDRRPSLVSESSAEAATTFAKQEVKGFSAALAKVPTHLTATLDVTAVDTNTGESVWFYRRSEVKPAPFPLERDFLMAREGESWWPEAPRGLHGATPAFEPPPAGALTEQAQALAGVVVADFLSRIRGG
jgi:hypothetical protein